MAYAGNEEDSSLIDDLRRRVERLELLTVRLRNEDTSHSILHQRLQEELHSFLVLQSLGANQDDIPMRRYFTVRTYISDAPKEYSIEVFRDALTKYLDSIGLEIVDDFPAELGSWWKRWFASTTDLLTQPEAQERLKKLERAAELQLLHEHQAAVDKAQAEATAALITSLKDTKEAAVQVGSLLLVKSNEQICARSLTPAEMIYLERHPQSLRSPRTLLQALAAAASPDSREPDTGAMDLPLAPTLPER